MMETLERMEKNMYDPGEYQESDMADYDAAAASKPKSKLALEGPRYRGGLQHCSMSDVI